MPAAAACPPNPGLPQQRVHDASWRGCVHAGHARPALGWPGACAGAWCLVPDTGACPCACPPYVHRVRARRGLPVVPAQAPVHGPSPAQRMVPVHGPCAWSLTCAPGLRPCAGQHYGLVLPARPRTTGGGELAGALPAVQAALLSCAPGLRPWAAPLSLAAPRPCAARPARPRRPPAQPPPCPLQRLQGASAPRHSSEQ